MSDKRELCKRLNKLCIKLDKKYSVNEGGCCFVALTIAKELEKLKIKYSLKVANHSQIKKKDFPNNLIKRNTCYHYYLHVNYYEDINSDLNKYSATFKNINSKSLKYIYEHGWWNDIYNTSNNKKK